MNIMMAMMKCIPKTVRIRLSAPMINPKRKEEATRIDNGIKLNLENLLICGQNCGTCPSFPNVYGEALYCASGASSISIKKNGCNCLSCPIFDECGSQTGGYFCDSGAIPKKPITEIVVENNKSTNSNLQDEYLTRFMTPLISSHPSNLKNIAKLQNEHVNQKKIQVSFKGDKEIEYNSYETLLSAALKDGIPHVHICGGKARCSTCRVIILEGLENCSPRNEKESLIAQTKGFSHNIRLACQTTSTGNLVVKRLVLDEKDESEAISEGRSHRNIAGTEVNATILFSDIRSFTSFSEKNMPYDIVHLLNRYFNLIGEYIDKNGGYIDKYMGDGIMVTFGLEKNTGEHPAILALRTAKQMFSALEEFNLYLRKHFQHQFEIGIGIHYGPVIIGNLGYYKKMEFTAIGDTVNTASRIESLNKKFQTKVLVSKEVYELTKKEFHFIKGFKTHVKGKEEAILVYLPDFG